MRSILVGIMFVWLCMGVAVKAQEPLAVQWSTFLGGSGNDEMRDCSVDRSDNVYVCGVFTSTDFPKPRNVPSSADTVGPGGYVASFDPDGRLRWLTYLTCIRPHEIVVSFDGVVAVAGSTSPTCGPVNAAVVVLDTMGERLAADIIVGGSDDDVATCVDILGNALYVGGITQSTDLNVTANAPQPTYGGGGTQGEGTGDGFVAKYRLTRTGSTLQITPLVITYYGGRYLDEILTLRAEGNDGTVFIGGRTRSDVLPGAGFVQGTRPGPVTTDDGFVARLDTTTLRCQWSMFCGQAGNDVVFSIQPTVVVNSTTGASNVVVGVTGVYNGQPFQQPGNANRTLPYSGGTALGGDAFYFEISMAFQTVLYFVSRSTATDDVACTLPRTRYGSYFTGTLLFGVDPDPSTGFNAYRWNTSFSTGAPTIVSTFIGNGDELTLDAEQARFGFGGFDNGVNASYLCGSTTSTSMPGLASTDPVFQRTASGMRDGFLVKIGCASRSTKIVASATVLCSNADSAVLTCQPTPRALQWEDGSTLPTRVVRAPGTYRLTYQVDGGCAYTDSIVISAGVPPVGRLQPGDTIRICDTSGVLVRVSGTNIDRIVWSGGEVIDDSTIRVRQAGSYVAQFVSADGCLGQSDTLVVETSALDAGTSLLLSFVGADSARPGETVSMVIRIAVPSPSALQRLPTEWTAIMQWNTTMLYPLRPLPIGSTNDTVRTIRVSGQRTIDSDTLGVVDMISALGNTDTTRIIVDSLRFLPCGETLPTESVLFRTAGICRIDSVGRFIQPRSSSLQLIVSTNPIGSDGAVGRARGDDTEHASAFIVSVHGETVDLTRLPDGEKEARWQIPSALVSGRYLFVVQTPLQTTSAMFVVVR